MVILAINHAEGDPPQDYQFASFLGDPLKTVLHCAGLRNMIPRFRNRAEIRRSTLAVEIRISKSKFRNKFEGTNVKKLKLSRFLTFEIQISDLFRISRFGFRTSNLVKMVNLFPRGTLAPVVRNVADSLGEPITARSRASRPQ